MVAAEALSGKMVGKVNCGYLATLSFVVYNAIDPRIPGKRSSPRNPVSTLTYIPLIQRREL
jgi:hypothetical protein